MILWVTGSDRSIPGNPIDPTAGRISGFQIAGDKIMGHQPDTMGERRRLILRGIAAGALAGTFTSWSRPEAARHGLKDTSLCPLKAANAT